MRFPFEKTRRLLGVTAYGLGMVAAIPGAWAGDISIEHARAQASPPKATVGRAYVTLLNTSAEVDHLVSATAEVAQRAEISGIRAAATTPNMRQLFNLDVPAGGHVDFTPGGYHVLLRNLKKPLVAGDTFRGTLTFQRSGVIFVEYKVEAVDRPSP